jgi:glycosyltransferase involved in cell wall biosynthesis
MNWPWNPIRTDALPATLPGGGAWPRISVVTPSFNQGRYIEETILSVLHQGYPDVEHIVIDGGSRDETAAVLDRYRAKLAHAVSEPDRGQSHAINKGMARATGRILTWLNSDDRLAPGALAALAMAFHTSGADMIAGMCELWREGVLIDRHLTSCDDGPLPLDDLLDLDGCWNAGQFFFQPEVAFTRDLWTRAGGQVDETAYYSMDYELWLRFAAAGARLHVIGRPVAQFRLHPDQKTAEPQHFKTELPKVRAQFMAARGLASPPRPSSPAPGHPARIVFFNDIGGRYGAGIAHARLANALAMARHDVTLVSASRHPRSSPPSADEEQHLLDQIAAAQPDVVIAGNLHGASLPVSLLDAIAARWPTAFVMHDLWISTGRCAYTGGCEKLLSGCDDTCPTPTHYPPLAPSKIAGAWSAKRRLLGSAQAPLLLANSRWTLAQVHAALGDQASPRVETITLGVGDEYVPSDRQDARRRLHLPEQAFIILLSATSLSEPRKGRALLLAALSRLRMPDAELLLVGAGEEIDIPDFRTHRILYQDDPATLAMIYSAADVFVGPSLEECLGQVFLEAAACGVPSIGFAVGGVHEALRDGVTGLLAADVTSEALADAIERIHADSALRHNLSAWARIVHENDRTLASAAHRLQIVLRRNLAEGDRIFGRKFSLRPASQTSPVPGTASLPDDLRVPDTWHAIAGFGPWEGPYPEWNLGRCRWQERTSATFHVTADVSGPHRVAIRYRNLMPAQRLRISTGDREVFAGHVPVTPGGHDAVLRFAADLQSPRTLMTCEVSQIAQSPEGRSLALLISGVEVAPTSGVSDTFLDWVRRRSMWIAGAPRRVRARLVKGGG